MKLDEKAVEAAPIRLDTAGSALFVAKVQADALNAVAVPIIVEELSKRPPTHPGEIILILREKAAELERAALTAALEARK